MIYDRSNMPASSGGPKPQPKYSERADQGPITGDDEGNWSYPSAAAEGYVNIEVPLPPGSVHPSEQVFARDFGHYVATKMQAALRPTITAYKVSPLKTNSPAELLGWFSGVAKGLELLDGKSMARMEQLSEQFATSPKPDEFFTNEVKPFLASLTPNRR